MSIRASGRLIGLRRTVYPYQPDLHKDDEVILALSELVERYPYYGFPKLFHMLRRNGVAWNHKQVHRVYFKMGLNIRRRGKGRLPNRTQQPLCVPAEANQTWSVVFKSDSPYGGNREVLAI